MTLYILLLFVTVGGRGMKQNGEIRNIIYIHENADKKYVLSYGIEFFEFAKNLPFKLNNLLLLNHQYDHGSFNMHTLLEFVESEKIQKLAHDDIYGYGDFCWIDFEEEAGVDELEGQEIAELLYLGHTKQHLQPPFYSKLNNQFAYLAHDDGWFNKTYYRNLNDFYSMLGSTVSYKLSHLKGQKLFFGLKKGKNYPFISKEVLYSFKDKMKEGMVISIEKSIQSRGKLEIPIWVMGDYLNMDAMYEDYEAVMKTPADGFLVFDRKTNEWSALVK